MSDKWRDDNRSAAAAAAAALTNDYVARICIDGVTADWTAFKSGMLRLVGLQPTLLAHSIGYIDLPHSSTGPRSLPVDHSAFIFVYCLRAGFLLPRSV